MYYERVDQDGFPMIDLDYEVHSHKDLNKTSVFANGFGEKVFAPFGSSTDMFHACEFAEQNFTKPWIIGICVSVFCTKKDAMYFKLNWSS